MKPKTAEVNNFANSARIAELWTAIKTALALKADITLLENYTTADAVATAIATALTNYATNDSVTSAITSALAYYMTTSEINDAITEAIGKVSGISIEVVDTLPESGKDKTIYFVKNGTSGNNAMDEYMWINEKWELIGSTRIDLTNYWSKEELKPMTSEELEAILV